MRRLSAFSARVGQAAARPLGSGSRHRGDGDRGALTLMVAILFPVLVALAGLVIDGGTKLNDAENAYAFAQEAARAGAGQVNRSTAYSGGTFTVDQAQAIAAARAYLATAGVPGTVVPEGSTAISVTVTISAPTKVLSIIGIDHISATSSASASLVTGITRPTS